MKFAFRLQLALALVLFAAACSQPADEPASASQLDAPAVAPADDATAPAVEGQAAATTPARPQNVRPAAGGGTVAGNNPGSGAASSASPSAANVSPATPATPAAPATPAPEIVTVPAGTTLVVTMIDAVSTGMNKAGDRFTASISSPVTVDGKTAFARGTKVQGRVESVSEPGRVQGKAAISLVLTQVIGDKSYSIATLPFSAEAESTTKQDAVKVGGGAAIGALIGAIAGGKKGAAVGAAVGGGAGTTAVLATRGDQITIDSETKVNFVLQQDVAVQVMKSAS